MRFTLAAGLALTAAISVLCYLLTAKPSGISYALMMAIMVFAPICAVAGIVYGKDNLRAFCIGAIFPLALLVWSSSAHLQEISFDPAAYGWQTQGQTNDQLATATITYYDSFMGSAMAGAPGGGTPTPGGGFVQAAPSGFPMVAARPWFPVYDATVSRAQTMRNPTCALSITAILGGGLVMAIRGGLKRKESIAGENTGG